MFRLFNRIRPYQEDDLKAIERLRNEMDHLGRHDPANTYNGYTGVVSVIDAFTTFQKAKALEDQRSIKQSLQWTKYTFTGLSLSTIANIAVAIIGHQANALNAENGRAWLAPYVYQLTDNFDQTLGLSVTYINSGKDPAVHFRAAGRFSLVESPKDLRTMGDWINSDIDLCSLVNTRAPGRTVFPSTVPDNTSGWDMKANGVYYDGNDKSTAQLKSRSSPDPIVDIKSMNYILTSTCATSTLPRV